MKIRTLIKILLVITGTISLVGYVVEIKVLELYSKPMNLPLLFMMYWFNTKKMNGLFVTVLLLLFIGDVIVLMGVDSLLYLLLSSLFCYFILIYFLIKDFRPLQFSKKDVVSTLLSFCLFSYIVYEIYTALILEVGDLLPYVQVYFVILYSLFLGAILQYVNIKSKKSFWFMIAIASFIIGDICFSMNHFFVPAYGLRIINGVYQLLAVFFLIQYMIADPESLRSKIYHE